MQRREDPAVRAKVGVAHVRAFERAMEAERDATKIFRPGHMDAAPNGPRYFALQGEGENFEASGSRLKCVLVMKFCARYFVSSTIVVTVNHSLPSVSE